MEPPLLLFLLLLFSPSVENANERRRQSASSPPPPVVDTAQGKLQGRIVDYNGKQTQVRSRIVLFYVLYGLVLYGTDILKSSFGSCLKGLKHGMQA